MSVKSIPHRCTVYMVDHSDRRKSHWLEVEGYWTYRGDMPLFVPLSWEHSETGDFDRACAGSEDTPLFP